MNTFAHPAIGAAPADIGDLGVDLLVGRIGRFRKKGSRCHDHSALAVTALRHVGFHPHFLNRVRTVRGEAFDGDYLVGRLNGIEWQGARPLSFAIDMDSTGAALGDATTIFRSGKPKLLPQQTPRRLFR